MSKRKEQVLQEVLNTPESWNEAMASGKLYVIDVHQSWCGPCTAIVGLLRRLKNELGDPLLKFAIANVDLVDALEQYRGKCEPSFLFFGSGNLVAAVRGADAPLIQSTIQKALADEKKVLAGEMERTVISDVQADTPDIVPEEESEDADEDGEEVTVKKQLTVAVIKPDVIASGQVDEILAKISEAGIEVVLDEERTLQDDEARQFYQSKSEESFFEEMVSYMTSGPCRVLVLTMGETGEGVVELWREIIGPFDAAVAKENNPDSLRALYGTDATSNGLHGSGSGDDASRELAFFFPDFEPPTFRSELDAARAASRASRKSARQLQRTLALIRPDALKTHKDAILASIADAGFQIAMQKEVELTLEQVEAFYAEHKDEEYFPALCNQMTSGPVLALCLAQSDAVTKWKSMLGPKVVSEAIENEPECLRAKFHVEEGEVNMLHGSDDPATAQKELSMLFGGVEQTIAVIKPDAQEQRDAIIAKLQEAGFMISCQKDMNLSAEIAGEIYKSKEGAEFYDTLIEHMTSGPTLMMVLSAENAVERLREVCGPTDPEAAKETAPESIRAQFATSLLANAIHSPSTAEKATENIRVIFGDTEFDLDGSLINRDQSEGDVVDGSAPVAEEDSAPAEENASDE